MQPKDIPAICPTCHRPVESGWYFCPNCGTKLQEAPLPTGPAAQIKLYASSIVLPMILFLFVTRWQGLKYARSHDPKARRMGVIAWILIVLSTVATVYLAYVWTEAAIQSQIQAINTDLSGL
ncbi:MAG: zinc ribbon domain-containing protein [Patescibacteria group bacterium]|nr:zinc ribbon domain-containing protein [Patescibacteria group bacterium]MDE1945586.1 zinc ribbon domain-containing protein [Patescibacteria group bacterium]